MKKLFSLKTNLLDRSGNSDMFSISDSICIESYGIKCKIRKMKIFDTEILIPEDFYIIYKNSRRKSDKFSSIDDYIYYDEIPYWHFEKDLPTKTVKINLTIINRNPKIMDESLLTPKQKYIISSVFEHSDIYNYILAFGCTSIHIEIKNKQIVKCIYWFAEPNDNGSKSVAEGEGDFVDLAKQQEYIKIDSNWNNVKGE